MYPPAALKCCCYRLSIIFSRYTLKATHPHDYVVSVMYPRITNAAVTWPKVKLKILRDKSLTLVPDMLPHLSKTVGVSGLLYYVHRDRILTRIRPLLENVPSEV